MSFCDGFLFCLFGCCFVAFLFVSLCLVGGFCVVVGVVFWVVVCGGFDGLFLLYSVKFLC